MFFDGHIVRYFLGNIPVIVTSQHDGYITYLDGVSLPMVFNVANDVGSRLLVETMSAFSLTSFYSPYVFIYKVQKSRSSWELYKDYLEELTKQAQRIMRAYGRCLVLDIHRFHKKPECDAQKDCDIIFGTNLRKSVEGDIDFIFAQIFRKAISDFTGKDYSIYVPTTEVIEGTRFGATGINPDRIIQSKWLKDRLPEVSTIQIEFYKELLALPIRDRIAKALAMAIERLNR